MWNSPSPKSETGSVAVPLTRGAVPRSKLRDPSVGEAVKSTLPVGVAPAAACTTPVKVGGLSSKYAVAAEEVRVVVVVGGATTWSRVATVGWKSALGRNDATMWCFPAARLKVALTVAPARGKG